MFQVLKSPGPVEEEETGTWPESVPLSDNAYQTGGCSNPSQPPESLTARS